MSERGVFAVDRGVWDHHMFTSREAFSKREAWMWLISEAAWKPHRRRIAGATVNLDRGQIAHSLRHLADQWSWSVKRVRGFLDALTEEAMIATTTDTGVTVITVCKYNEYQIVSLPKGTDENTAEDTTSTTPSHTARAHEGHNKEDKEYKEYTTSSLRSDVVPAPAPAPKPKRARARSPLPDDWQLDDQDTAYAISRGFGEVTLDQMARAFSNYHRGKGNLMADWHAAWRTWCENEIKFQQPRLGSNNDRSGSVYTNPNSRKSGSTAVLAGVAAATERRARERIAAGQQRLLPAAINPAAVDDPDFFGAGRS